MDDLSGSTDVEDAIGHTPAPKRPRKNTEFLNKTADKHKHKHKTAGTGRESEIVAQSESSAPSLSPGTHAALTAALGAAILPCFELIDPLLEFTRACAVIKAGSARQQYVDEQEMRVRVVVEGLRGRFGGSSEE